MGIVEDPEDSDRGESTHKKDTKQMVIIDSIFPLWAGWQYQDLRLKEGVRLERPTFVEHQQRSSHLK